MKERNKILEPHISVKDAAAALGVHESFFYRRIQTGELSALRLSARRVVIPKSALDAFLDSRRTVPNMTL